MRIISNLKRSLAKQTLPEFRLLLSGRVRAVRCLASGGFLHSSPAMQTAVQVRFVMVKMPAEQSPVSMSREAYQSACGSGFLPSIGSGLRTPCSRLLPYDLDALTRP